MDSTIRHIQTIIIGAGPAGSVCGYILAKNQKECVIIEKAEFPREKVCGGGLTPKAVQFLERIYRQRLRYDFKTVQQMEVHTTHQMLANFEMKEGIRVVVRKDFDQVLLKAYTDTGGIVIHRKVISIAEKDEKIIVTLDDNTQLSCDTLVGADGANSIVRKYIDPNRKKGLVWMEKAVTYENEEQNNIKIFFDKRYPMGYGYLFPNQNGYVVGYGHSNKPSLDEFNEMLSQKSIPSEGKVKGAYIPTMDKIEYQFRKNIILIGDAGSYTDAVTSEGLFYAMKTGENAATAILLDKDFRMINERIIHRIRKIIKLAELFYSNPGQWFFRFACNKKSFYNRICRSIDSYIGR